MNNERSDISDPNARQVCHHFAQSNHDLNNHTKFTLMKITKRNKLVVAIQDILRKKTTF